MEKATRTIYGAHLETCQLLGIPYEVKENTTLNERFGINPNLVIPTNTYPKLGYFCIGIGGAKFTAGNNNRVLVKNVQHQATDASCYDPIPFVLREVSNDLSPTEKQKYALRKAVTINNENYYAYYLRRLDLTGVVVSLENRHTSGNNTTITTFTPDEDNLYPTPPNVSNQGSNTVTSDYVAVNATVNINLPEQECQELLDVATILFGDSDYAFISEIGLCTGVDKIITNQDNSTFKDAIGVQVAAFVSTQQPMSSTSTLTGSYSIGVAEPLLTMG
jgi:hypothetical protein